MDKVKDLMLADAIASAIEAEKENVILSKSCLALAINCLLLAGALVIVLLVK